MWRPKPRSLPWLLRHEARLGGRGLGGVRSRVAAIAGLVVMALFHAFAWAVMRGFDADALLARAATPVIVLTAFTMLLMLGSAFGMATQALFERGDLDLLMASPLPVEHVFTARAIYVGLASSALVAVFIAPFANMGPAHGHWGTLAAYPVLAAYGLACSALAFLGTFSLVRAVGPRRARVLAQVLGALIGAALVLAMQLQNILPAPGRAALERWIQSDAAQYWASAEGPLAWPFRAIAGDAWLTPAFVVAGVGFFTWVVRTRAAQFARASRLSLAAPRPVDTAPRRRFRSGLARVVIAKELTLVARDPALIGRSLLQLIYLLPLFLMIARKSQPMAIVAAALVLLAVSLGGSLAWLTMSGEEAPGLLGASPVPAERLRWLKVAAVMLPMALLMAPFVAWFVVAESIVAGAVLATCLAGALVACALMQVWTARPGTKRDLRARYKQNVMVNFAEQFTGMGWAMGCYLALAGGGGAWWWLAAALALLAPAAVWMLARRRRALLS